MTKRLLTAAQVAAHQRRVHGTPSAIDRKRDGSQFDAIEYPLIGLCDRAGLPVPLPEFVFHPVRKWRFDYAWPDQKIAVEIDGGVWTKGRHTRPAGFLADMEKLNAAARFGWRILRYTPDTIADSIADLVEML